MIRSGSGAARPPQTARESWQAPLAWLLAALAVLLLAFGIFLNQADRSPSSGEHDAREVFLLDTEGETISEPTDSRFSGILSQLDPSSLEQAAAGETVVVASSGDRQVILQPLSGGGEQTPTETIAAVISFPSEQPDSAGLAIVPLVVASILLMTLFGAIAAAILRRALRPNVALAPRESNVAPVPREPDDAIHKQRRKLIESCIDLRDLVTSEAQREQLRMTLEEVGVTVVETNSGDRFDPDTQKAVDTVATSDPLLDQKIAETEQPGYKDGDTILRLPQVLVYRTEV